MSENTGLKVTFVTIDEDQAGQRIDNFLITFLKGVPKSAVYKILRKGEVRVNKKRIKPLYKLQLNDELRIPPIRVAEKEQQVPDSIHRLDKVVQLQDNILYEDNYLMVLNKPSGLAVHGGSGLSFGLIEAIRALRPEERSLELVHRLDRDTSGCILISKKRSILKGLHEQLREKTMEKNYWALVKGEWSAKNKNVTEPLKKIRCNLVNASCVLMQKKVNLLILVSEYLNVLMERHSFRLRQLQDVRIKFVSILSVKVIQLPVMINMEMPSLTAI